MPWVRSVCARIASPLGEGSGRHAALFAVVSGSLLAICMIFGLVMYDSRRDVSREVEISASNLASAVAHDVDRNIELIDLSLQAAAGAWSKPAVQTLAPELRDLVLFDNSATAQGIGVLLVLDKSGMVRASSKPIDSATTSFADRDYFQVHVGNDDVGLFVSKPFISRVSGSWQVGLSRRINNLDGGFSGVVVGTLQLTYLNKLYHSLNLGPDSNITLFRTDGRIITREPYSESDVRRSLGQTEGFNQIRSSRAGSFEGASPVDGKHRVISFHRVGNLPLIQDIEVSVDQAYGNWWHKTLIIGGILGFLCLSSTGLLLMLRAELNRRIAVEATLEHLAGTDPLTELANRRQFSEALSMEWHRAIRDGSELSLLMIDADSFKCYNDVYGHPAGDDLLRTLARCIKDGIHRPSDLAARYGGEEFVVLLPNTKSVGAFTVAEEIRRAVSALGWRHSGTPLGRATVSVGSATMKPSLGETSEALLAASDAALYRAKAEGRNCTRVAPARPKTRPALVVA